MILALIALVYMVFSAWVIANTLEVAHTMLSETSNPEEVTVIKFVSVIIIAFFTITSLMFSVVAW